MKKKRPVLQDVADRVGVTKMTVSRFLRNPEQVSVALRGKIAAALDELGYIPNRAPDILSNATSRAIGVLLPSLTNQVFAEVLRGIESVTDAHGYQTMLAHYGYKPEMEQERLESMLSWNIDGLILTERTHTPRTLKMIEVAGIPVVELMDSQSPCLDIAVGFDNFEADFLPRSADDYNGESRSRHTHYHWMGKNREHNHDNCGKDSGHSGLALGAFIAYRHSVAHRADYRS